MRTRLMWYRVTRFWVLCLGKHPQHLLTNLWALRIADVASLESSERCVVTIHMSSADRHFAIRKYSSFRQHPPPGRQCPRPKSSAVSNWDVAHCKPCHILHWTTCPELGWGTRSSSILVMSFWLFRTSAHNLSTVQWGSQCLWTPSCSALHMILLRPT
ncbi:hypothetical protein BKA93DRAFT_368320 [Sparassis latifolia]